MKSLEDVQYSEARETSSMKILLNYLNATKL